MATVLAILEAWKQQLLYCIVEGDSRITIANHIGGYGNWEIANSVAAAQDLTSKYLSCCFSFIPRKCHFMAHNLASGSYFVELQVQFLSAQSLKMYFVMLNGHLPVF